MINKDELLKRLKENLAIEERAVPIYRDHLVNTLFLSPFSEPDRQRISELLNVLKKDSERHAAVYRVVISGIEESPSDVY